jgi:DNA polymerase III delta prime subunit
VGKTSIALALASQIGAELHHLPSGKCNAQSIEETVRLCHYMPMTPGGLHLVLVDEADGMTKPAQLALLSKLDATAFPPNTVFIFTCNGTEGLEPRFLSRCRTVEFSSYGMASEITSFLDRVWHSEGGNGNGPDLSRVVKDSRNNVRDALMTLEVELMAL